MALRVNSLVFVEIFVNSSRLTAQDINTTLLHTRELHVPGGGGYSGVKRIGMTVGNPIKLPPKNTKP